MEKTSHEIGGNGTAGQGINGDHTQTAALGGVGGHADDRNVGAGSPANGGPKGVRAAGKDDDAVYPVMDGGFEGLLFAFAQGGAGAVFDLQIFQQDRFSLLADPGAHFVPEGGGALGSVHGNPQSLFGREIPGRQIRAVTEISGDLQDSSLGRGTYARIVVQGAMNGSD